MFKKYLKDLRPSLKWDNSILNSIKIIVYFRIFLVREVQDLHIKNHKTFLRETFPYKKYPAWNVNIWEIEMRNTVPEGDFCAKTWAIRSQSCKYLVEE